jgi:hypothetical protein
MPTSNLLSRVSVTKTRVWIGESVYWILTSFYTLKIIVTIAHVTSHTKSSNSSSGHNAVPLELWNSREVNSRSRILSYPLGTDHAQKTQFYCCVAQTTQRNKSRDNYLASSLARWLLPSNDL